MIDFSVFDSLLDATFVVNQDGMVVYCNEVAANLCQISAKRLSNKANLADYLKFTVEGILPFDQNSPGRMSPSALIETSFSLLKVEKVGKVQLSIRAVSANHWVFFLHDVGLEELLASKYRSELAQKEEYAKNLEKLVDARTRELQLVNQTLNAILDSLGQGFFTFDPDGNCGKVYTKACEEILEGRPVNKKVWEVLGLKKEEPEQFKKWMSASFNEILPFDELKPLGPNLFEHSQERHVVLEYYPIRQEEEKIREIVVVATDKTTEFKAQAALEVERQFASMVVKFTKNKDQFLQFLKSVSEGIADLIHITTRPPTDEAMAESFRILHTLEGEAGVFSIHELRELSRECQHHLKLNSDEVPSSAAWETYSFSLVRLQDGFANFLKTNERVFQINANITGRSVEIPLHAVKVFLFELQKLSGAQALIERYCDIFLTVPISSRLTYFDGLIHSVAEKLGKKVKPLVIQGGELRIVPDPYQGFFSSLVHAFRNAVDHGLEMPLEREWDGKDPEGTIRVEIAAIPGGHQYTISDDGKGIDPTQIREKLRERYPDRDFSKDSDAQIIQHVALPGFSSRDSVGEFSGRGVGMDALREEVLKLGGNLYIQSTVGKGTAIRIFIPEQNLPAELLRSA